MNPLSALNLAAGAYRPELPAPGESLLPKSIAPAELQQLGSSKTVAPSLESMPTGGGGGFADVLGEMVQGVSRKQSEASIAVNGLLSGQGVGLHQAMIAMEEASVSFQLMVEVRNRLLESYQELMRMQV